MVAAAVGSLMQWLAVMTYGDGLRGVSMSVAVHRNELPPSLKTIRMMDFFACEIAASSVVSAVVQTTGFHEGTAAALSSPRTSPTRIRPLASTEDPTRFSRGASSATTTGAGAPGARKSVAWTGSEEAARSAAAAIRKRMVRRGRKTA